MFTEEIQVVVEQRSLHRDVVYGGVTFDNVDVDSYPDGMPVVKAGLIRHIQSGETVKVILRPTTLQSFVTGLFTVDALKERGVKVEKLILPFIPAARQDRLNPEGDYLFTLKSVAKMINDRGFDQVIVLDPHSTVASALIDRSYTLPFSEVLSEMYVGYDAIIAPDAGAGHRAEEAAKVLGENRGFPMPVIQAEKTRDVSTGKLSGFAVNVETDKHYLVFDDICDGGGTFIGLGEKIKEQGARAGLFVSHGVFSKGTEELNKIYEAITTTDSTLFDKHDAEVLRVTERMTHV